MASSSLRQLIERVKQRRAIDAARDWTPPPPPDIPPRTITPRVAWRPPERTLGDSFVTIEHVREKLPELIRSHANGNGKRILLVKAPPGVGKTYAGILSAQRLVDEGMTVGYFAAYRDFWHTVQSMPTFDPEYWYEWLPIHQNEGEDDRLPTTCRYADAMYAWLERGYHGVDLCKQLCLWDKHIQKCPYRTQSKHIRGKRRAIFAMHQHLVYGVGVDLDYAIVDELPLQAVIGTRKIPYQNIMIPDAYGPLKELLIQLSLIALEGQPLSGKALLDRIGDLLMDVYAQIEVFGEPLVPHVHSPEDVHELPYFYVGDLLEALSPEYEAWQHGWEAWVERVTVAQDGIWIIRKNQVYEGLPHRMVIFDATGTRGIYARIFDVNPADIEVYAPQIKRRGRVIQVVGRLNGQSTFFEREDGKKTLGREGKEMVRLVEEIIRRHPGKRAAVVTYKSAVNAFADVVGANNVAHFGAMRGIDRFNGYDMLFVVGSYMPPPQTVMMVASALNAERIKPFGEQDEDGKVKPLWTRTWKQYFLSPDSPQLKEHPGLAPWRQVGGYWHDPDLSVVFQQLAHMEVLQAIHRSRVNSEPVDVYLFSPFPLEEYVDEIHEDPGPLLGAPEGIYWKNWLKLKERLDEAWREGRIVRISDLMEWTGANRKYIKNQKWLHRIAAAQPERWDLAADRENRRRGPKPWVLIPATYEEEL